MSEADVVKRFPKGIVYVISNDINRMVYIGSTTQTESNRMNKHRWDSKVKSSKFYVAIREIRVEHFHIETIETLENVSQKELERREFDYIEGYNQAELYNTDIVYGKRVRGKNVQQKVQNMRNKGGTFDYHHNRIAFKWFEDGKRPSRSFSFGVKSSWDREEAYFHAIQFKNSKFPQFAPELTPQGIADRYSPANGKFMEIEGRTMWV